MLNSAYVSQYSVCTTKWVSGPTRRRTTLIMAAWEQ